MTRVSPPEDDLEFPGPHESIRVTDAPCLCRYRAVHTPKAPAPTTIVLGPFAIGLEIDRKLSNGTEENTFSSLLLQSTTASLTGFRSGSYHAHRGRAATLSICLHLKRLDS